MYHGHSPAHEAVINVYKSMIDIHHWYDYIVVSYKKDIPALQSKECCYWNMTVVVVITEYSIITYDFTCTCCFTMPVVKVICAWVMTITLWWFVVWNCYCRYCIPVIIGMFQL